MDYVFGFRLDQHNLTHEFSKIFMKDFSSCPTLKKQVENKEILEVESFPQRKGMQDRADLVIVNVDGDWILGFALEGKEVWFSSLSVLKDTLKDFLIRCKCSSLFFLNEDRISVFRV